MSTRTNLRPQVVANAASMAGNITSTPTILQSLSLVSYTVSWSGSTPVGNVSIQGSNDYSLNANGTVDNAGTWNTLTLNYQGSAVTEVPITGNTGNGLIDIAPTAVYATRLIYIAGSGTGALTAIINGKVS